MNCLVSFLRGKMAVCVILSLVLISCNQVYPPGVSQFRGDNRDGHYSESNLLDQWPEEGPEMLWSSDGLGVGYAAPVVTEDKIFVNGEIDSVSHLFAFDLEGKMLWKAAMGPEFMGKGQHFSHPVLADGKMYIRHGEVLLAYRVK